MKDAMIAMANVLNSFMEEPPYQFGGIIMRPDNWRALGEDEVVEFDVHCKMNKAWANEFMSMLNLMQSFGELGTSEHIDIYSDGDGDFRPKFDTDFKYTKRKPYKGPDGDFVFDAG